MKTASNSEMEFLLQEIDTNSPKIAYKQDFNVAVNQVHQHLMRRLAKLEKRGRSMKRHEISGPKSKQHWRVRGQFFSVH